jgi:hypothetical protein
MAVAVVASTAAVSAVAVSTAVLVVDFTGEASAVALSTAVVVSVGDVSPVAVSTAVAFVATVLVITDSLMMSSSAASAFRGGGAGAIRTDITVTTITRTITMDTAGTHTATTMDTAGTVTTVAPVMDIAMAADHGISGVCGVGDKLGYGSFVRSLTVVSAGRMQ